MPNIEQLIRQIIDLKENNSREKLVRFMRRHNYGDIVTRCVAADCPLRIQGDTAQVWRPSFDSSTFGYGWLDLK